MKVKISKGNTIGSITYDEKSKELSIDFPDSAVVNEIKDYLNTKRVYRIPESQRIDDYREELARPIDSEMHLDLALCTLDAQTGVSVDW